MGTSNLEVGCGLPHQYTIISVAPAYPDGLTVRQAAPYMTFAFICGLESTLFDGFAE